MRNMIYLAEIIKILLHDGNSWTLRVLQVAELIKYFVAYQFLAPGMLDTQISYVFLEVTLYQ